jgi:hypothetical protein
MLSTNCKELAMRSSKVTRGFGAFSLLTLAAGAVLVFHSAALAQQAASDAKPGDKAKPDADAQAKPDAKAEAAAAPGQEELPPEYAPPPGYRHAPPPPHGYGQPGYAPYYDYYYGGPPAPYYPPRYYRPRPYASGPVHYYPEPITYRPFFFGVGLGVGGVALFPVKGYGDSSSRAGMSYNLRFGFGVSPRWSIVLSGDGAYAYISGYSIDQSVWSIGPQVFINRHLYARAGIGVAMKSIDLGSGYYDYYSYDTFSDSGMGWTLALGWEFMQSYHIALGLEAAATYGHYQSPDSITMSKNQGTVGVNFVLTLF